MDEGVAWLVTQGYSEAAARAFSEHGHAPSMVTERTPDGSIKILRDIESCAPRSNVLV